MIENKDSTKAANKTKKLQNLDRKMSKIDRDVYSSSFKVICDLQYL